MTTNTISGNTGASKPELTDDLYRVAQRLGRAPTMLEYRQHGSYDLEAFYRYFQVNNWLAFWEETEYSTDELSVPCYRITSKSQMNPRVVDAGTTALDDAADEVKRWVQIVLHRFDETFFHQQPEPAIVGGAILYVADRLDIRTNPWDIASALNTSVPQVREQKIRIEVNHRTPEVDPDG